VAGHPPSIRRSTGSATPSSAASTASSATADWPPDTRNWPTGGGGPSTPIGRLADAYTFGRNARSADMRRRDSSIVARASRIAACVRDTLSRWRIR
jgi:hypothetical protein